jgi:hypothetical protein
MRTEDKVDVILCLSITAANVKSAFVREYNFVPVANTT